MSDDSASYTSSHRDDNILMDSPGTEDSDLLGDGEVEPVSSTFNFNISDLTLRAVEGTEILLFNVHRVLLAELDGGFKDIILAQDKLEGDLAAFVDIQLSPTIVDILLRFIYPMSSPTVLSLTQWQECYAAAEMYKVPNALRGLRSQFDSFIEGDPLRAFAIAARFNLDKELEKTARQSLGDDLMAKLGLVKEFESMTASRLIQLIQMHMARDAVVRNWAAALTPLAPKCPGCQKVHWTEVYINLLRAEIGKNSRIAMEELFRMSLVIDAVMQRGTERCSKCPDVPGGQRKIDEWSYRLISSLTGEIEKLSALKTKS
ncbi:hypothetical protein CALVIDRAFT_552438 [Calocera viscosa TUFC12733]|uniref:BTB domain-containing protein n=1 Tax=Calocera viscosa (strain TUFC12733) TaxID=1330018 RepID=A0A167R9U7_CALVF|nr:hypothetical protein CALVIDRAFT_552438 [Calocera viscosa TUFC12733]